MDGTKAKMIACGFLVSIVANVVAGEYDNRGSEMVEGPRVERMHSETSDGCIGGNCLTQNSEGPVGAMWFGPRLGRRRRSDIKLNGNKIETLGEILGFSTWNAANAPGTKNDKRQETTFTPRLGRQLEDAISLYDLSHRLLNRIEMEKDNDREQSQQQKHQQQSVFPLRLDRTNLDTESMLEHELRNFLRKLQMP